MACYGGSVTRSGTPGVTGACWVTGCMLGSWTRESCYYKELQAAESNVLGLTPSSHILVIHACFGTSVIPVSI